MAYATITKPSLQFNTKLYTGNSSTLNVTGVGFQPDFTWIKDRTSSGDDHALYDAVRGATKRIRSNQNDSENTQSTGLTSFDSDGFTVGDNGASNGNGDTFVSWNWKANGQGSSNTSGTINSTYTSANTTAGFSIVTYTGNGTAGATIGHGLGAKPDCMLVKQLTGSNVDWRVYLGSDANYRLALNNNDAEANDDSAWNDTEPTSTLFSVGSSTSTNANSVNYVAYLFTSIKGYSKFSKFTGNGNANGQFVYTGFKPAFVMVKRLDTADWWGMFDNKREGYNPKNDPLYASESDVEGTLDMDLLSNGFKWYTTNNGVNGNGGVYGYMAFAAEPLVANVGQGIPATAR